MGGRRRVRRWVGRWVRRRRSYADVHLRKVATRPPQSGAPHGADRLYVAPIVIPIAIASAHVVPHPKVISGRRPPRYARRYNAPLSRRRQRVARRTTPVPITTLVAHPNARRLHGATARDIGRLDRGRHVQNGIG